MGYAACYLVMCEVAGNVFVLSFNDSVARSVLVSIVLVAEL